MPGDAVATLSHVAANTERIKLLTAVVPIFGIHPAVMARQALMAHEVAGGRFTLGIGLAHRVSVEGFLGMSFDRPAPRMCEFLNILNPMLRGEAVDVKGEFYTYNGEAAFVVGEGDLNCAVATLGPIMLRMCAEQTAGTVLWMANTEAIETYVAPRLGKAAAAVGKEPPEIICSLPVALTDDAPTAREVASRQFAGYGDLPSYRSVLNKGGADSPGDAALVVNAAELDAELERLEQAGVTSFRAEKGGPARTREYLSDRARARNA